MKIAKHVTFFYMPDRVQYINAIIQAADSYGHDVDVYIHTNVDNGTFALPDAQHARLRVISHDLSHEHPYRLTWKCRDLMHEQVSSKAYDAFMYVEDDIMVPKLALDYWLAHKHIASESYNIGFFRIEYTVQNQEVLTDIIGKLPMDTVHIGSRPYVINRLNPYCGFWIYDQETMLKWTGSPLWHPQHIHGYGVREQSAIGLHGSNTQWFTATVLPLTADQRSIESDCKVYHLPNNYALNPSTFFGKVPFDQCL